MNRAVQMSAFRLRQVVVAIGGLALLCVTTVFTFGQIIPDSVMPIWSSARGLGNSAFEKSVSSHRDLTSARSDALRTLMIEPGNIAAVRAMGVIADAQGNAVAAAKWFEYAETLTRRDFVVNIWLVEHAVARGDIAQALHFYDVTLRTSRKAGQLLYPVLVDASVNPAIRFPLAHMLATRPPWRLAFGAAIVTLSSNPAVTLPDLISALHLDVRRPLERELLVGALARLMDASAFSAAERLYRASNPDAGTAIVQNGSFDHPSQLRPFDWTLTDKPEVAPLVRPGDHNRGNVLSWNMASEWEGDVATQTVLAPPGRYILRATIGDYAPSESDDVRLRLACAVPGKARSVLGELILPPAPSGGRTMTTAITVPVNDCAAQNLSLAVRNDGEPNSAMVWITDISLVRAPSTVRLAGGAMDPSGRQGFMRQDAVAVTTAL